MPPRDIGESHAIHGSTIADVSRAYHIEGVGDFNGDGKSDILWRHDEGQVSLWEMNGDQIISNTAVANVSNDYHIEGVGDFNGDGHADVLWRHDSGLVALWEMNGDHIVSNTAIAGLSNQYQVQVHHFDLV